MGFNNVYGNKYIRIFDYVHTFRMYVIKIFGDNIAGRIKKSF